MDIWRRCGIGGLVVDRSRDEPNDEHALLVLIAEPMHERAKQVFPKIPELKIRLDWSAGTRGRAFGYFDPSNGMITISPRLLKQPAGRIAGVIRHEIGHLVHETIGRRGLVRHLGSLSSSDEVLADQIAEYIWNSPIFYDAEDVQTIDPQRAHSRMRPAHLPNPHIETQLEYIERCMDAHGRSNLSDGANPAFA